MTLNVLIHIGPPKTGTSAIQYCLQNDSERLASLGIYYPKHTTDINGISSGNVNSIYDVIDGERVLSKTKFSELVSQCKTSNMHTLLLSSEFFFERLSDLVDLIPTARFIAYIRNPLDSFESLYNQSVKRHHHIKPISRRATLPRFYLAKLDSLVEQYSADRFMLRSYSSSGFEGGSIITDFYSVLSIEAPSNVVKQINLSYSFEALEFKRWLNVFCSPTLALQADKLLQAFNSSLQKFTLLDQAVFERYKFQACEYLTLFCKKHNVNQGDRLLRDVGGSISKPYIEQKLSFEQFKVVADYVHENDIKLYKMICHSLYLMSYHACFKSEFGQYFVSRYTLSEVSNTTMFKQRLINFVKSLLGHSVANDDSEHLTADVDRLREKLNISDEFSDADLLREVAIIAEKNRDIGLAYHLMNRAQQLRPNGSLIRAKMKYYESKIGNQKRED